MEIMPQIGILMMDKRWPTLVGWLTKLAMCASEENLQETTQMLCPGCMGIVCNQQTLFVTICHLQVRTLDNTRREVFTGGNLVSWKISMIDLARQNRYLKKSFSTRIFLEWWPFVVSKNGVNKYRMARYNVSIIRVVWYDGIQFPQMPKCCDYHLEVHDKDNKGPPSSVHLHISAYVCNIFFSLWKRHMWHSTVTFFFKIIDSFIIFFVYM